MEVLVVGAGPCGLMMAIELVRQGVDVRIIDKKQEVSPESRAAGIHARTLEAFERIGVVDRAIERGIRLVGLNVFSHGKEVLHASLDRVDSPYPFVLGLSQAETERLLADKLRELGVEVEWGVELASLHMHSGRVEATLSQETLSVSYLIGCDGAHSVVRQEMGLDFTGSDYHQHFIWCDAELSWSLPMNEVAAFLDEHAGMFVFPLSEEGRARLVFAFFDETHYNPAAPPTIEDVNRLVAHFGPEGMRVQDPQFLNHFYVHHRIVTHYREGRVFLVGDSAHIHSPVGGQGMNTGIQDACNLGWKLGMVVQGKAGPELLGSYNVERHPIAEGVLKGVGFATKLLTLTNPISQTIRDHLISFLGRMDPVREHLLAEISETAVHYLKSPIVLEQGTYFTGGPKAGCRAPDVTFGDQRLFSLFKSSKHQILLFSGQETLSDLRDKLHAAQNRYGDWADVHLFTLPEQNIPDTIVDPDGVVHERYGALDETLYLIRPDGYVGYRSQPADLNWFAEYLHDKLTQRVKV